MTNKLQKSRRVKSASNVNIGLKLIDVLKPLRKDFYIAAIFSAVVNLLMLTPTLYMLQVFDRVLISRNINTLIIISLICVFFFFVLAFSEWIRSILLVRIGLKFDRAISGHVFLASYEGHLSQSNNNPGGGLGYLITLRQFITGNGFFALFDSPWFPLYVGALFVLSPILGWLAVCFSAVQILLAWYGFRRARFAQLVSDESSAAEQRFMASKMRNVDTLLVMGMIPPLFKRWVTFRDRALLQSGRALDGSSNVSALSKFLRYVQQSASLGVASLLVIEGELSIGAMIAANVLMGRALAPIDTLTSSWPGLLSSKNAFAKLDDLLRSMPLRGNKSVVSAVSGNVKVEKLSVFVKNRGTPILDIEEFQLTPGTVTAIIGPSGSGKSTLGRAILGLLPDGAAKVSLDGLPIEHWDRESLGAQIGYLPQAIELFDGNVAENIARMGHVSPSKVLEAAKQADLHQTVLRLPKGYDTRVGSGGMFLSGGQRQRVGLARALYGNPNLLVLDEPNANLDDVGENALYRAIGQLKDTGKTVVLITHRPHILKVVDRLVILKNGRIFLDGRPEVVFQKLGEIQDKKEMIS